MVSRLMLLLMRNYPRRGRILSICLLISLNKYGRFCWRKLGVSKLGVMIKQGGYHLRIVLRKLPGYLPIPCGLPIGTGLARSMRPLLRHWSWSIGLYWLPKEIQQTASNPDKYSTYKNTTKKHKPTKSAAPTPNSICHLTKMLRIKARSNYPSMRS